jgi:hypothetical protein
MDVLRRPILTSPQRLRRQSHRFLLGGLNYQIEYHLLSAARES